MAKYNYKKDVCEKLSKSLKTLKGNNGKEYTYKFDDIFSEEKKKMFLSNFFAIKKECDNRKESPDYDIIYQNLLIKYFTDAINIKQTKDVYTQTISELDQCKDLEELGLYYDILFNINKEEMSKLVEYQNDMAKHLNDALKEIENGLDK